ncbi:MAG: sulfatase [Planctomycetaceae bacterium]
MRNFIATLVLLTAVAKPVSAAAPNIVFIIADDASLKLGETYGCDWVKTPNIDKLAKAGLTFDNCYVPTSKCAPTRAAILSGRNPWQNGQAANHQNYFPSDLPTFTEALTAQGVYCASTGKVWGPGKSETAAGEKRDFDIHSDLSKRKAPGERLADFLKSRPQDKPFFYWHGSPDPHRKYELDSGVAAGKKTSDIDHVPAYWPDNETIRSDMLDYAIEVERFDAHVGELVQAIDDAGLRDNTMIVVTSDHGMPFPRVKGHTYDDAHHVPLVIRWPNGIVKPGRRVEALISAIDFAPTFLELDGVDATKAGMHITGRSFVDLLKDNPTTKRPFLLIGRERNDVYARPGSPTGLGYPVRAIRSGDSLYVRNFEPDRWPCGNPELGLKDTDASPTKALIEALGPGNKYWEHAFGKRPAEQLFDLSKDPDCVTNLATDPAHAAQLKELNQELMAELKRQQDPRAIGGGEAFDSYPTVKPAPAGWDGGDAPATPPQKRRAAAAK